MLRLITPHLYVEKVEELTAKRLGQLGLDALLLDVDCTLKSYRQTDVTPQVAAWLDSLRSAGVRLCLVSNGRGPRIRRLAANLALPCVAKALKPLPVGCRRALSELGSHPSHTAMVGDQVFADVMAGRLAGLFSILVTPIRPEEEPWFTRSKRPLERLFLRRALPKLAAEAQDVEGDTGAVG